MFMIYDWSGNIPFPNFYFDDFDTAEEFLSLYLGDNYDTDRGEYVIDKERV